jgi:septum formation protein
VIAPDVSESVDAALRAKGPEPVVATLAARKAAAVRDLLPQVEGGRARWILGADTLVAVDGSALGKPENVAEAASMLRLLSGRPHVVHTGLALVLPEIEVPETEVSATRVWFRELSEREIAWYLSTGEWEGAAGAYRIQERGAFLVREIHGSHSNIVGLPLETIYGMLSRHGYLFS